VNALIRSRDDGTSLLAIWPPEPCSVCPRVAAFGIVRLMSWGNVFVCLDCWDDPK
jgi:hypothetical protein